MPPTFHHYARLPVELQRLIWLHALSSWKLSVLQSVEYEVFNINPLLSGQRFSVRSIREIWGSSTLVKACFLARMVAIEEFVKVATFDTVGVESEARRVVEAAVRFVVKDAGQVGLEGHLDLEAERRTVFWVPTRRRERRDGVQGRYFCVPRIGPLLRVLDPGSNEEC